MICFTFPLLLISTYLLIPLTLAADCANFASYLQITSYTDALRAKHAMCDNTQCGYQQACVVSGTLPRITQTRKAATVNFELRRSYSDANGKKGFSYCSNAIQNLLDLCPTHGWTYGNWKLDNQYYEFALVA